MKTILLTWLLCLALLQGVQSATGTINTPTSVPLTGSDGKQVGTMMLNPGLTITILGEVGDQLAVQAGDSKLVVPKANVTLNEPVGAPAPAPTAIPAPTAASKVGTAAPKPAPRPTRKFFASNFTITLKDPAGKGDISVPVTAIGNGPKGVILFPPYTPHGLDDILKEASTLRMDASQCTFFLWYYPVKNAPFSEVGETLNSYLRYGEKYSDSIHKPKFEGIAESVVTQIEEITGIPHCCLVGNSLGAGLILWDYEKLSEDPERKILLISPTRPLLPPAPTGPFPALNTNTILLASEERVRGWHDESEDGGDPYITESMLPWIMKYRDEEICKLLIQKNQSKAKQAVNQGGRHYKIYPGETFLTGHKIIGEQISLSLLAKFVKITMGLSDRTAVLQR